MKLTLSVVCVLIAASASVAADRRHHDEEGMTIKATVELIDGSRIIGDPLDEALRVRLAFGEATIPLASVAVCEVRHKEERLVLKFRNGDRLTGKPKFNEFRLETILGKLTPNLAQIDRVVLSTHRESNLPPGEGPVAFGGVNWQTWRTGFEIQGDKIVSLPKAREGFNYGHSGNGRGPMLVTNVGNSDWKNYSIEADFCVSGVSAALNPYGLPLDYHDGGILFHVANARESHNEPGLSAYNLSVSGSGDWTLSCQYNSYCAQPVGWGNPRNDGARNLASGSGLRIDREKGNHFRIDVIGERIQVWVDDQQIANVVDLKMDQPCGGQTIDHGGVGFVGGMDAMIWVKNFSARVLHQSDQSQLIELPSEGQPPKKKNL